MSRRRIQAAAMPIAIVPTPHTTKTCPMLAPSASIAAAPTAATVMAIALMMLFAEMIRARCAGSLSCCSTA